MISQTNSPIPLKICKHGDQVLRISQEFLKTESQNCDPTKISHLGDQFWGISREFPRNQLQEMILKKFCKESHGGWRIWGNLSLLLLGIPASQIAQKECNLSVTFYVFT